MVTIKGADYCVEGEHSVDMVFCELIYQTVMRWHFQVAKKTIQMRSAANILLREFLSSEFLTLEMCLAISGRRLVPVFIELFNLTSELLHLESEFYLNLQATVC